MLSGSGVGVFQPLLQLAAEAVEQQQVTALDVVEKLAEHGGEQGFPVSRRAGALQGLPQGFQLVHEFTQAPGQAGLQTADLTVRFHLCPGVVRAHAVTE